MRKHDFTAVAYVRGSGAYPDIRGCVRFRQMDGGVLVTAEIRGLPGDDGIFAFHIHSGGTCSGSADDPFRDAQGHYHPENCPHPAHAGDMPPLFSNKGYAAQAFLTGRFTVREIIGRTVIIHAGTDDFTSQPAGNAGARIACGVIRRPGCR